MDTKTLIVYNNKTIGSFFDDLFVDRFFAEPFSYITDDYFSHYRFDMPAYPHDMKINEEGTVTFQIAVPGLDKENITIDIDGGYLNIDVKPSDKTINSTVNEQYICKRIANRAAKLQYKLSDKQDIENIKVSMDKGLMNIVIPVKKEHKPVKRTLQIE
jgi:HSP20 family molecular chaperone IbpA